MYFKKSAAVILLLLLLLLNTVYFKQHRVYDVELHKVRHTGLKTGILV